ncbi:hypothetical protein AB685_08085 [Bacillus sp. LL01]|uniref:SGNH/GDSL hydrolase family protein n=1 Tax=Bacillus sp. LL01 TaxID=1665556 RepID=UPI00064D1FE8|nr:SGNH/GDSL hydrolase family protein [Bacillus sp. LL01]KMJ59024.1 hypothetical protein AB685_08085 [Bacillus sp. LL01]
MKKLVLVLFCVLGLSLIIYGKSQYENKIAISGQKKVEAVEEVNTELVDMTDNMSNKVKELVIEKIEKEEKIQILIVGSNAIMTGDAENLPWPLRVKEGLDKTYGEGVFELEVINYKNISTNHLIESEAYKSIFKHHNDIILFEPLLLNDNGFVKVEDSLANISLILEAIAMELPQSHVILQPANPISHAPVYVNQIEKLQEYAKEKDIEYLSHWDSWPNSDELDGYLKGGYPNSKGQELWAKYILGYFASN